LKIGVVSDTHGLLRPEVLPRLEGCEHILHLGDVGDAKILDRLRAIAPVTAVRGNVDTSGACAKLPETEVVLFDGASIRRRRSFRQCFTGTRTRQRSGSTKACSISTRDRAGRGGST
jgi:putative phosphoesterase